MKRNFKGLFMAGAAAIAMTAAAAGPAKAFDEVNWVWDAVVSTTIDTSVTAETTLVPLGLNQVENDQFMLGNTSSAGSVSGFENVLDSTVIPPPYPVTDLASVETSGTAMGNNATIESDVQVIYDSRQIFGGIDPTAGVAAPISGDESDLTIPGTITATSSAIDILNASVDSSATGVANNLTVDLDYLNPGDALAIGNNEQTALAVITSTSTVETVTLDGFTGLGTLDDPTVSSTATSVGNNFGASVQQAVVPVVPPLPI